MKDTHGKGAAAEKERKVTLQPPQERRETLVDFILRVTASPSQAPFVLIQDYVDMLQDVVAVTAKLAEAESVLTSMYYDLLTQDKLFGGTDHVCRAIALVHGARERFVGISEYTQERSKA